MYAYSLSSNQNLNLLENLSVEKPTYIFEEEILDQWNKYSCFSELS